MKMDRFGLRTWFLKHQKFIESYYENSTCLLLGAFIITPVLGSIFLSILVHFGSIFRVLGRLGVVLGRLGGV